MANMAQSFVGLPLGQLICSPIVEVAKGQAELCRVYLDYLFKLAYKDGKPGGEANIISFKLNRPVTDGKGNISMQTSTINAPLLSLVPVPAFTMQEATVDFTMEVKEQVTDTNEAEAKSELSASVGGSFWGVGFESKISGSVSDKSTHSRTTDNSAKYDITAKAVQQPPAEGMAKLTSIFASVIEPINVGSGSGGGN